MRIYRWFSYTVALSALAVVCAGAQTTGSLSGKMAFFNYIFGAPWQCTTNVPAMHGQPARVDTGPVTFSTAAGNVMHVHVKTSTYEADQYFGYAATPNAYWSSIADNMGQGMVQTSPDGKTYTGSFMMGATQATQSDTYTRASDNRVTVHEVTTVNGQQTPIDTVCTR